MLHLGTHARLGSVLRPLQFVNLILVPVATISVVLRARGALLNYMALSRISLLPPNQGFFPMQQMGKHRRIGNVRRRSHRSVDDLGLTIHSRMGLHTEIPGIAFLGLVYLRIALRLPVL